MSGHLIHIGYAKTGTNFLRRWFKHHPQLEYADGGIAGFRNVYEIASRSAPPGVLYRVTSCEGLAMPHPAVGRDLVDYDLGRRVSTREAQAQVTATLAELFPLSQILVLTRGFRSLILSMYSQFVRTGGLQDFAEYCTSVQDWVQGGDDLWDYNFLVELYTARFGTDNVIILPYELLRDDQQLFMSALERRLGLQHCAAPEERVNASLSAVDMGWYPRLNRAMIGVPLGSRLKRRVLSLYLRGSNANRFRILIRLLQHVWPAVPVTHDLLPDVVVECFQGRAECLRTIPHYGRYAQEYLL